MELTWQNVEATLLACMLNDQEIGFMEGIDPTDMAAVEAALTANGVVVVECALQKMGFVRERLEARREDIVSMLSQLEDSFHEGKGGGMSMMRMVATRDGELWGEQFQADLLFGLAAGLGLAEFCLPREMWSSLPGGMPYVVIKGVCE